MNGAALTAYLNDEWAEVIATAPVDVTTVVTRAEAVYAAKPGLSDAWAEALGDYFLLRRADRAFTAQFDVSVEGNSFRLNQLHANVQDALKRAQITVGWLVDPTLTAEDGIAPGTVITVSQRFLTGGEPTW